MAEKDEKGGDDAPVSAPLSADDRLQRVLEARYDPSKLSALMRGSASTRGQRLDHSQRQRFEGRYGVDLGDVRIFTGDLAEEITRAHDAEALTIGNTGMILMRGSAQYAPGSVAGTALLAHELAHVAQARPSAVSRKGLAASMTHAHEEESEAEAERHERAVAFEEAGGSPAQFDANESSDDTEFMEELCQRVMEIHEEEERDHAIRSGQHD